MSGTRAGASTDDRDHGGLLALGRAFGIAVDPAQVVALRTYGDLLFSWNARINLTGARSWTALVAEHLPDAFALARTLTEAAQVLDVGSGGGLPALPLAILRPTLAIHLAEPIAKKGAFLRTAIRDLGIGGRVRLLPIRVDEAFSPPRGPYDAAFSRATLPPREWLELGSKLVVPGGRVFALTTAEIARDLAPRGSRGSTEPSPRDVFHRYLEGRRVLVERNVPRGTGPSTAPA